MRRFFLFFIFLLLTSLQAVRLVMAEPCAPSGSGGEGGFGGATGLFGGGTFGPNDAGLWILLVLLLLLFGIFGLFFYQRSHQTADLAPRSFIPPSPPENYCGDARVTQPNGVTTTSNLKHGSNPIGRDPGSSIQLNDPKASSRHADLHVTESQYVLTDLNSSNGTFVNGERITQKNVYKGDQIQIGDSAITL